MSTPVIRGVIGYTITPFAADGSLDLAALGLVLCFVGARWHGVRDGFHRLRWGRLAWRTGWLLLVVWVISVAVFWAWQLLLTRGV